jgi:hypothetical protein
MHHELWLHCCSQNPYRDQHQHCLYSLYRLQTSSVKLKVDQARKSLEAYCERIAFTNVPSPAQEGRIDVLHKVWVTQGLLAKLICILHARHKLWGASPIAQELSKHQIEHEDM